MNTLRMYLRDATRELEALDSAPEDERVDHLYKALLPLLCAVWEIAGRPNLGE